MKAFNETEVKNFRRLTKVYNYKNITVESDMFADGESNVVRMKIYLKQVSGTDERNLGNIARICKAKRISLPDAKRIAVIYTK